MKTLIYFLLINWAKVKLLLHCEVFSTIQYDAVVPRDAKESLWLCHPYPFIGQVFRPT